MLCELCDNNAEAHTIWGTDERQQALLCTSHIDILWNGDPNVTYGDGSKDHGIKSRVASNSMFFILKPI